MAGYAVECGLKACIAKLTNQDDFPRDRRFVEECYTHDLDRLLRASGLKATFDADVAANTLLGGNWGITIQWNERSRYEQKTQPEAQQLYDAIVNNADGVLPWIRRHW